MNKFSVNRNKSLLYGNNLNLHFKIMSNINNNINNNNNNNNNKNNNNKIR